MPITLPWADVWFPFLGLGSRFGFVPFRNPNLGFPTLPVRWGFPHGGDSHRLRS